jgi:hypothetical protein
MSVHTPERRNGNAACKHLLGVEGRGWYFLGASERVATATCVCFSDILFQSQKKSINCRYRTAYTTTTVMDGRTCEANKNICESKIPTHGLLRP